MGHRAEAPENENASLRASAGTGDRASREVLDAIRRIVRAVRESSRAAEQAVGIGAAQLFVLHRLAGSQAVSLNELAARTLTHQSSVSVVVSKLVGKGLLTQNGGGEDGRRVAISVTPAGRALAARAPAAAQERLLAGLALMAAGPRRQLAALLGQLVEMMALPARPPMLFEAAAAPRRARQERSGVLGSSSTTRTTSGACPRAGPALRLERHLVPGAGARLPLLLPRRRRVRRVRRHGAGLGGGGRAAGGRRRASRRWRRRFCAAARAAGRRACFFATEDRFARGCRCGRCWSASSRSGSPLGWDAALRGSPSLREQLRRARAKGVRVRATDVLAAAEPGAPLRDALDGFVERWLGARELAPLGFLARVDPLAFLPDRPLFVAEREGALVGILSVAPIHGREGWLLQNLLRAPDAPNGTAEALFDAAMREARRAGCTFVTLGLAPLAGRVRGAVALGAPARGAACSTSRGCARSRRSCSRRAGIRCTPSFPARSRRRARSWTCWRRSPTASSCASGWRRWSAGRRCS